MTYNIKFTDINKTPITIEEGDLNTSNDTNLFGRIKLEYGELLNEDLLHLLEHYACPEDPMMPGRPDLSVALDNSLNNPPEGQLWFNSTQQNLFIWNGSMWNSLGAITDYASNSGKILHGQQLPLPVSASGVEFSYDDCVWIVSPNGIQQSDIGSNGFSYMVCTVNDNGIVNHQYAINTTNELIPAVANYIIIGIKNNNNLGINIPPAAAPPTNLTPTPTVTPTVTPSIGVSVTPTQTPQETVTPSVTVTPTLTTSPTPTPAPSQTPTSSPLAPISGVLYINPSIGLAGDFGVGTSSLTTCNRSASNFCLKIFGVNLANITGGFGPPYTLQWNLSFQYTAQYRFASRGVQFLREATAAPFTVIPPSSNNVTFGNIQGYSQTIVATVSGIPGGAGLVPGATAYIIPNYSGEFESGSNSLGYAFGLFILTGSSVTIYDSSFTGDPSTGNPLTLFTPVGRSGQVPGTALTSPIPDDFYQDTYLINI